MMSSPEQHPRESNSHPIDLWLRMWTIVSAGASPGMAAAMEASTSEIALWWATRRLSRRLFAPVNHMHDRNVRWPRINSMILGLWEKATVVSQVHSKSHPVNSGATSQRMAIR